MQWICSNLSVCLSQASTLKMKAVGSSNMLAPIDQTMQFHKPRDSSLNTLQMGLILKSHAEHLLHFQ
jgi:hypothetical protein